MLSDCIKIAVIRIVFPAHWQECYICVGACPGEKKRKDTGEIELRDKEYRK